MSIMWRRFLKLDLQCLTSIPRSLRIFFIQRLNVGRFIENQKNFLIINFIKTFLKEKSGEVENVTAAAEEEKNDLKEEHVEIIEIVDIEYADEAKTGGDVSIDDELTSTIVEIRIVTSEGETKVTSEEKVKDETTLDLSTSDDPVSARSNQEVAVEFGDETLESERTDNSKRQSTLLESIERVLNESYEIVIEDQPKEE